MEFIKRISQSELVVKLFWRNKPVKESSGISLDDFISIKALDEICSWYSMSPRFVIHHAYRKRRRPLRQLNRKVSGRELYSQKGSTS